MPFWDDKRRPGRKRTAEEGRKMVENRKYWGARQAAVIAEGWKCGWSEVHLKGIS